MTIPVPQSRRGCGCLAAAVAVAMVALAGGRAGALINPRFTPVHLVKQSDVILVGTITPDGGEWRFTPKKALNGAAIGPPLAVDLSKCTPTQAADIGAILTGNGRAPVVLFSGGDGDDTRAFLHVAGIWLAARPGDRARWHIESLAPAMSGVYAGGTDMLIPMCRYILAEPKPQVPVSVGMDWIPRPVMLGEAAGEVTGMQAVVLRAGGPVHLFVASTVQDRMFRATKHNETFADVTAEVGLEGRSRRFVWTDFNGDRLPDLMSWDGEAIRVRQMAADGKLGAAGPAFKLDGQCLGLAACDLMPGGERAVMISTPSLPSTLHRNRAGDWTKTILKDGSPAREAGEPTARCAVADFDNDGFWDVFQPRRGGGIIWKGSPDGLTAPARCSGPCPEGPGCLALGDFNQDGYLDIFLCGTREARLYENDGHGAFADVLARAGSLSYKPPAGLSDCMATDLNHDGRPDLCLLDRDNDLMYHFNRGFRCFGEEGELRLFMPGETDVAAVGQVAGAVADFNGDGSLDLAVAFVDGKVRCYYNAIFNRPMLRVALPKGSRGPVTVSIWQGERFTVCVGTLPVPGGWPGAGFTLRDRGDATIRWSEPGKPALTKKVSFAADVPQTIVPVILE